MLLNKSWIVSLSHIYREANRVADGLAALGHTGNLGAVILKNPPPCILSLLTDDSRGISFPRLLSCNLTTS
ncbi:hypothetical protein ACOSP7_010303 [Xanthoceras sorbifolium]